MKHNVTKGKTYLVTAKDETTVTDVESGYILKVVPANSQAVIVAISNMIETSGECKLDPFANAHLLALGSGTGGGTAEIIVDATYNATSTNAQSGVAVAQAIASISSGSTDPNNCEWAIVYRKNRMGDESQPDLIVYKSNWDFLMGQASQWGGLIVPLGDYVFLVRKPAGSAWDDNDFGLQIFTPLILSVTDASAEVQVIYFNF